MSWQSQLKSTKSQSSNPESSSKQPQVRSRGNSGGFMSRLQNSLGNRAIGLLGRHRDQQSNAPDPAALEERRLALVQERDTQAPIMAETFFHTVTMLSMAEAQKFLQKDKQSQSLRDALKQAAITKVEGNIDAVSGVSDDVRTDAKRYAASLVQDHELVSSTLTKYAEQTVKSHITDGHKRLLEMQAKQGYNEVAPDLTQSLETQVSKGKKNAERKSEDMANRIVQQTSVNMKKTMQEKIEQDAGFLDGQVEVGDLGKEEAENRHQLDAVLANDADIDSVYINKLYNPIKDAVIMKLGVGRRAWRRSKQLNEFRQKMKDAARGQANEEIDSKIDSGTVNLPDGGSSVVGKKFYSMMARSEAYSLSKKSVDAQMEAKAAEITRDVLQEEPTKKELKQAAKTSAYDVARSDPQALKKIRRAALSGAKTKAISIYKAKQSLAVKEARKITKGDKETGAGADVAKQDELAVQVKDRVSQDKVADKAINKVIKADSLNSGLAKIASIIDLAVPNPGDSAGYEFELKIPVEEHGVVYVMIGLAGEASKEKDEVTVSCEATLGAGFNLYGIDANGRAGFFLESQGKTSKGAMNLISYGMYRGMRKLNTSLAERLWGQGNKSGMGRLAEAELWAAMIEQKEMTDDGGYVDMGLLGRLQGSVEGGVASGEAAIEGKMLSHFSKESINALTGNKHGDSTDLDDLENKAKQIGLGHLKAVIGLSGGAEFSIAGQGVSVELEGSAEFINGKIRAIEAGVSGSIPFVFGEEVVNWGMIVGRMVPSVVGGLKSLLSSVKSNAKRDMKLGDRATNITGSLGDVGSDVAMSIPPLDSVGASLASKLQGDGAINDTVQGWASSASELMDNIGIGSSLDLSLSFALEFDDEGKFQSVEVSVEAAQTKSVELDVIFAKVALEKSKRLGKFALSYDKEDKWEVKGGLLGIEKS